MIDRFVDLIDFFIDRCVLVLLSILVIVENNYPLISLSSLSSHLSLLLDNIIAYVEKIIENGFAYESNGSVYFDTVKYLASDHQYPKLQVKEYRDVFLSLSLILEEKISLSIYSHLSLSYSHSFLSSLLSPLFSLSSPAGEHPQPEADGRGRGRAQRGSRRQTRSQRLCPVEEEQRYAILSIL